MIPAITHSPLLRRPVSSTGSLLAGFPEYSDYSRYIRRTHLDEGWPAHSATQGPPGGCSPLGQDCPNPWIVCSTILLSTLSLLPLTPRHILHVIRPSYPSLRCPCTHQGPGFTLWFSHFFLRKYFHLCASEPLEGMPGSPCSRRHGWSESSSRGMHHCGAHPATPKVAPQGSQTA